MQKVWSVTKFYGGLSSSSKIGIPGSFYFGQALDYRTDPDLLQTNYAATNSSGTIITDEPLFILPVNSDVYAYGNTGILYKRTGGTGAWAAAATAGTASTGHGMEFYSDYIYLGGSAKLARYGPLSGTASLTDPWNTATADTWHPMVNFLNYLCVGNNRYLATWDGATWNTTQLTLPPGYRIRSLAVITGKYLAIGTWQGNNIYDYDNAKIFLWDGAATTYNDIIEVSEGGINALLFHENNLYIWAGVHGNLYSWNGNLRKLKKVPFVGTGKYIEVYPGAVGTWGGIPYFGISAGDSTTAYRGVYSYGQSDKNYPVTMNFDYPVSSGTVQGTTVSVGAIRGISPSQMYIGYKDSSTYRIDQVSSSLLNTSSRYETLTFDNKQPYKNKYATLVKLTTRALATGESVVVHHKLDNASSWTALGTVSFSADGAVTEKRFLVDWKNKEFQLALAMAGNGTTAPKVTSLEMMFDEEEWM